MFQGLGRLVGWFGGMGIVRCPVRAASGDAAGP